MAKRYSEEKKKCNMGIGCTSNMVVSCPKNNDLHNRVLHAETRRAAISGATTPYHQIRRESLICTFAFLAFTSTREQASLMKY